MSLFDKFMESSPLTFQLATKFSSKIELNYKKHVLFEGELNVKTKDNPPSTKFFKIVDRKFVCSLVNMLNLLEIILKFLRREDLRQYFFMI